MAESQTTDLETRFQYLLQPIRDLTRNWDVDIAQYLEGYLEDLEKVGVTFNGGKTTMNFAEAALLIQGSTCVYSKKVEHLYSLVYQVLNMVANRKQQQKPSSMDNEGNDNDAVFPQEEEEEFLLLDDTKHAVLEKLQKHFYPEKESPVHPVTPMNLIVQEEGEKDSAINNVRGELLGNMSDFHMNCSSVQPGGSVFLDLNLLPLLGSHLRLLASSTPYPQHEKAQLDKTDPAADVPPAEVSMRDDGDPGFDHDALPMDDDHAGNAAGDDVPEGEQPQVEERLRPRREQKKVQFAVQEPKPARDHWAVFEPFSAGTLSEKKLNVGRTYKPLPGLEVPGSKKRKKQNPKKEKLPPILDHVNTKVHSQQPKISANPCMVPDFSEFDEQYYAEIKRREKLMRERRKQQAVQEVVDAVAEQDQAEDEPHYLPAADDDAGDDANDGDEDQFDSPEIQWEDNLFAPVEAFGGEFINSVGSSQNGTVTYEELVRRHVENFLAGALKYAQTTEVAKRVAEWEEKITPKLEEEEQHEAFDIHEYGTDILGRLQRNQPVLFRRIVAGKPLYQIPRLFLATLQLANARNVELTCPGELEEAMDKLELRLVSKKRHHEELAEYQAPSLAATAAS